jgi:hypothetical protein
LGEIGKDGVFETVGDFLAPSVIRVWSEHDTECREMFETFALVEINKNLICLKEGDHQGFVEARYFG